MQYKMQHWRADETCLPLIRLRAARQDRQKRTKTMTIVKPNIYFSKKNQLK